MRSAITALILCIMTLPLLAQETESESWIDSAEAFFATAEERKEWSTLDSRAARDAFKERYWLRRDPTPGTLKNEFREFVRARVRYADQNWTSGENAGSLSGRGRVFVLFGAPATQRHSRSAPPVSSAPQRGDAPRESLGWVEGTESTFVWLYDSDRTPDIVRTLGVPKFEMSIVVDPNRRVERIQNPGLYARYRDIIAEKSITNPDLIPPSDTPVSETIAEFSAATVNDDLRKLLADASAAPSNGTVFGSSILWEAGDPFAYVWFFVPQAQLRDASEPTIVASLAKSDDTTLVLTAPGSRSRDLFTTSAGRVFVARLALPPGRYAGTFALLDSATRGTLASSRATLTIPKLEDDFAVSSIVLSGGVTSASDRRGAFRFGDADVLARADATFLKSETMWVFLSMANPTDEEKVSMTLRLRSADGKMLPATVPVEFEEISPNRYFAGFEIRLADLEPGDYSLYLTVKDAAGEKEEVRRADFRLIER